jgi:1,2-diacylglycerol 3-alpha-glucosyltransferase
MIRVLWIVSNIGPYHHARFNALAKIGRIDLVVGEIAGKLGKYPWTRLAGGGYTRKTLFSEATIESLQPALVASRLIRLLIHTRPDVCVVTGYSHLWEKATAIRAKTWEKVSLTTFVTTELDRLRSSWKETLKSLLLRSFFDGVICAGSRSRDYLLKLGVRYDRIKVCGNVVDNYHFAKPRERRNPFLPEGPFFVAVTRFSPEKNLPALLDAYASYAARAEGQGDTPWPLVLCGSGPLDVEIRARAEHVAKGRTVFLGFIGYDELPEVYQRAGCLVLPSISEPWGLVVNEAMAAGTPVLVSASCGCAPDLVQRGENGFVFSPTNIKELTGLMERVTAMPEVERIEMGRRGQKIVASFTPVDWAENFLELLDRCMARKKGMR